MASQTLEADQIGDVDQWTLTAGSTKVLAVQSPDDDDTSRIGEATNGQTQRFYVEKLQNAEKVNQVDLRWRARDNNNGTESAQAHVESGGSTTNGTNRSMAAANAYTTWTETNLAKPGGGNWSPSDFPGGGAGTQVGVSKTTANVATVFVTSLRLDLDVTLAAGAFVLFLSQWLGPLIAAGSHALLHREVDVILATMRVRPSKDWEYRALLESFRRRPVYLIG